MRWLHFILSHSIFISLCAIALCYQTYALLHVPGDIKVYAFIFFSTLSSYNFYWLVSKYSFSKKKNVLSFIKDNKSYLLIFSLAGTGMLMTLYFLPYLYPWVAVAVLLTLVYSLPLWPFKFAMELRKAGFLKTTLLAFTWAFVTVVLPLVPIIYSNTTDVFILLLARFCFMGLLCIIFDMRDMKVDKMHALHSLATDVSKRMLKSIMLLAFLLYLGAGLIVRYHLNDNAQLVAFLFTGVVVWMVYHASLKKQGYIFYYFVVDGLMLFSAALTFIASIF
jgi:hypothetical protein